MIELPRRSVTRFFIPLIDVLILLFCIFLLMPLVRDPADASLAETVAGLEERIRQLDRQLSAAREAGRDVSPAMVEELKQLREQRRQALQERLIVRVLEIDPETGALYYLDPERIELRNQADIRAVLDRDRRDMGAGGHELYYLILYPRRLSRFPQQAQREQFDRWFDGVPHGYDIPGAAPNRGTLP
jgi:hypothetical protein